MAWKKKIFHGVEQHIEGTKFKRALSWQTMSVSDHTTTSTKLWDTTHILLQFYKLMNRCLIFTSNTTSSSTFSPPTHQVCIQKMWLGGAN